MRIISVRLVATDAAEILWPLLAGERTELGYHATKAEKPSSPADLRQIRPNIRRSTAIRAQNI